MNLLEGKKRTSQKLGHHHDVFEDVPVLTRVGVIGGTQQYVSPLVTTAAVLLTDRPKWPTALLLPVVGEAVTLGGVRAVAIREAAILPRHPQRLERPAFVDLRKMAGAETASRPTALTAVE
jgi:hypothetical protein